MKFCYNRTYEFDGLDLAWEFPGFRGGAEYDKQNFISLVQVGKHYNLLLFLVCCNEINILFVR